MGRTKPHVRAVYLPSGLQVGVGVSRPQARARLTLARVATQQHEQVVAVVDLPQTNGASSHKSSSLPKASGSKFSFSGHDLPKASDATHEHESIGGREDILDTTLRTKQSRKTEERTKSELAIDGTDLLDSRKANPSIFEPGSAGEGRMRTRRSKSTRGDGAGHAGTSSEPTVSLRKDSKTMDGLEFGEVAAAKDASRASVDQQQVIKARTSLADPAELIATPDATLAATYAAATAGETVTSRTIAKDEERDQAIQQTSVEEKRITTTTATKPKSANSKSRFEKELETDGTPLLQRSDLTDTNSMVKEYYDGKRWYQVIGSWRPDWATGERTVDMRSKR